jgi:hypothetical protein
MIRLVVAFDATRSWVNQKLYIDSMGEEIIGNPRAGTCALKHTGYPLYMV